MNLLKRRWIYVVSGFVVLLFMGCSQAWSIFVVPIENALGWTRSQTSLAYTINFLCISIGSVMAGILSKKMSSSKLILLTGIILFLGFFGTSLISEPWQLYLSFGLLVGISIGMGYNVVMFTVPLWIPEKSATATGLLLMGYALSNAIFGPLLNSLIESIGIMNTFKVLSVICGLGIIISSFIIRKPEEEEIEQLPKTENTNTFSKHELDTKQMLRTSIFWVYLLLTVILTGGATIIANHCSPIMIEDLCMTSTLAAFIVSITAICNGIFRYFFGIIYDHIGIIKSILLVSIVFIISTFGMFLSLLQQNSMLFIISLCLFMLNYAGNAVSIPTIIRELFGNINFGLNYSIVGISTIVVSVFPTVIGFIQSNTGSYTLPMLVLFLLSLISFILSIIVIRLYKKGYD